MTPLVPRRVVTALGPIELAEAGEGPALLVVHGMPGDWTQARTIAEDLSGQARVLLVSRPGYGRTPLRSGRSAQQQAALYAALLDALHMDKAVVLGISGGGPSAYAFAATQPSRCRGLLLCCAVAPDVMTLPPAMLRLAAVPGLWRFVAAVARLGARVSDPKPTDPETLTATERELLGAPATADALHRFEAERPRTLRGAGLRNDTLEIAKRQQIPWPAGTLGSAVVLHGDADQVVPLSHARAYAELIPGSRLEVLPDLGHALPLFARDQLAALLTVQLNEQLNQQPKGQPLEQLRGAPGLPTPGTATAPAAPPP